MAEVINLLSKATNGRAIIVSDVGQHQMIAARYYQFLETNSHISSGGLGTMDSLFQPQLVQRWASKIIEL
nr:thiamine pyrophosphate-dependent enzyme [Francisella tularensis]